MASVAFSRGIRPTRRDLLLVVITAAIAYFFFTAPERRGPVLSTKPSNKPSRLQSLQHALTGSSQVCAPQGGTGPHDRAFADHLQKVGFSAAAKAPDSEEAEEEYEKLETKMIGHTPGYTMFEKLYLFNGQFWVLT